MKEIKELEARMFRRFKERRRVGGGGVAKVLVLYFNIKVLFYECFFNKYRIILLL